jgi:predicted nucleic acid-binding protein
MNVYIDADAVVNWEKGEFDLPGWIEQHHPNDAVFFPPTAWQQILYGKYAWEPARARKRARFLEAINLPVSDFGRRHAERAAQLAAELKTAAIGFADCQIAACALEDNAELLSFNAEHFERVPGLRLAAV